MTEYNYKGMNGLKVRTIGNDPSTDYYLRETGNMSPNQPQQCNPLSVAGRRDPNQNRIPDPKLSEERKLAEVKALKEAEAIKAASEKDLKKRNVRTPKKRTTKTDSK